MRALRHSLKIVDPCPIAAQIGEPGFCRHCERTVHDLRQIADADLVDFLRSSHAERVCAILPEPEHPTHPGLFVSGGRSFALAALLVGGGCTPHGTQNLYEPDPLAHHQLQGGTVTAPHLESFDADGSRQRNERELIELSAYDSLQFHRLEGTLIGLQSTSVGVMTLPSVEALRQVATMTVNSSPSLDPVLPGKRTLKVTLSTRRHKRILRRNSPSDSKPTKVEH